MRIPSPAALPIPFLAFLASVGLGAPAAAQNAVPTAAKFDVLSLDEIARHILPEVDRSLLQLEDQSRSAAGLPPRYAVPNPVLITPFTHGTLEGLDNDMLLWRLRVIAPGASSINFGFTRFVMPEVGRLLLYTPDASYVMRPFTAADNKGHGELWTPPVPGQETILELTIPSPRLEEIELELTQIGYGYRGFGSLQAPTYDSGSCNVDVVCSVGDAWRNEIPAIGVISTGGSTFCTGFMVNNTAQDQSPLFMTANHCGIGTGNAPSLVVFWNYETSTCGGALDGQLDEFNTGSTHLASYAPSDFTILLLDASPDPAWGVTFAGWNRSGLSESGAIAIHHPSTDEKRISFENDPTTVTSYLSSAVPGDRTHVRVEDWDLGTTEGGSSGSPLFNPAHQVVGQLHGGYAACGNDDDDWYGRVSTSWNGGGSPSSRLSDWLDPLGTGAVSMNTLGTLAIPPSGVVSHEGPVGGPFTNPLTSYALDNSSTSSVDWSVSLTHDIGVLINGGTATLTGTLAPGGSVQIDVTLGAALDSAPAGVLTEEIAFNDLTNGVSSTRTHRIEVGREVVFSTDLSAAPNWTMDGQWAWGQPTGSGGSSGNPDPNGGFTGANVLGYNLNGDYPDNLPAMHLTSEPLDFENYSGLRIKFMRWLNVESSQWDEATFRVSNDGVNWPLLYMNAGAVTDSDWVEVEYDISAIADGESTVFLRWTLGPTDSSVVYSGWNIDDISISGVPPAPGPPDPVRPPYEIGGGSGASKRPLGP